MTLEQLRQLYAEKISGAKALTALAKKDEPLTSEQAGQVKTLLDEADAIKAQIEQMERMAEGDKYMNEPVGTKAAHIGTDIKVTKDESEQPFKNPGEFFQAVKTAAMYPGREDAKLRSLKATGLSEGVPADGGYLIPPAYAAGILERMYSTGQILSRVSQDPVQGNDMSYNGIDETTRASSLYGGVIPYWVAEGGTITASKPKFRQVGLKLKKVAALCYATDELLEDGGALGSWLQRNVPEALRFYVEDAIFEGTGAGKPLGIMNSPCLVSVLREDANKITFSDVQKLWARRWAPLQDYVWLINQDVNPQLQQLGTTYQLYYLPPNGLAGSPYGTLLGRPVLEVEYAATMGTTGDIMLASLSQYQAITKGGIQAQSSVEVAFVTAETAFRFIYRIDGAPLWHSALTPFKGSNTQSPFVTLASASV